MNLAELEWTRSGVSWQLLGLTGVTLFGSRWVVQVFASRRAGRSVMTPGFWILSVAGSILLVVYFTLGPGRDPVGILANVFPLAVALYNLALAKRERRLAERGRLGIRGTGGSGVT